MTTGFPAAARTTWAASHAEIVVDSLNDEHWQCGVQPDYDVTLEPGEMLYLPYRWWHIVTRLWWTPRMLLPQARRDLRRAASRYAARLPWRAARAESTT